MKLSCLLVMLVLLSSCEGIIRMTGKIVAEDSGKEIGDARIELLDIPPIQYFDSLTNTIKDSVFVSKTNGVFTVHSKMIGMVFGPPKYRIRITKEGYQTTEIEMNKQTRKNVILSER